MKTKNVLKVGEKSMPEYIRAAEMIATDHDRLIIEARGQYINRANDVALTFTDAHPTWTIDNKDLGSIVFEGRRVTELRIVLERGRQDDR